MFQTKITSQGTISIPAPLRKKYGLMPGDTVTLEDTGKITITKNPDFASLREQNAKYLTGKKPFIAKSGDGFAMHVMEKYGQK
ncbi:MAG: Antidote-toxin recognition MazE, bacterial antitoxin [Candidatus Parcubacteria bacterium]|jgi:AbrB family looped-hinge helix DNA binding protein